MVVLIALAVLVGVVIGMALARWFGHDAPPHRAERAAPDQPDARLPDQLSDTLREAVNELEIGVIVADENGTIVYRNRAATAFAGTHTGAVVDDRVAQAIQAMQRGDQTNRLLELRGTPRMSLTIAAEMVPNGGTVVTIQDHSERIRIDTMRTDFVANISHELRTPVGAIAVLADALVEEADPEVTSSVATRMVDEAHRAVQTIDDLLELSRIETARLPDTTIELGDVVRLAVARGRLAGRSEGVDVSAFDLPQQLLMRGDKRQLTSALGNLVENAVKYSNPGGAVQVRVLIYNNAIEIMVADQGVGIPQRDLDRVFERFYRVDPARSRDTGGTGLGLAIVRHVANNHGGTVLVSSQEGEGSTFVLKLPASLLQDLPSDTPVPAGSVAVPEETASGVVPK